MMSVLTLEGLHLLLGTILTLDPILLFSYLDLLNNVPTTQESIFEYPCYMF